MDAVLRAVSIYAVLLLLFRVLGKRSLGQMTAFDFILLLIISEAIQNGLVGEGFSLTNAVVLIVTLMVIDLGPSLVKRRWPRVEMWLEGVPLVLVENGQVLQECLFEARVDEGDILTAARKLRGLERMEQIKYAVLERSGEISIIPWPQAAEVGTARPAA